MSVWLTIPSARPVDEVNACTAKWREMGYRIALWRDKGQEHPHANFTIESWTYPGYSVAVNALMKHVFAMDPDCKFCVAAGDDTTPDPIQTADTIAMQCSAYFLGANCRWEVDHGAPVPPRIPIEAMSTFGVMQPTGDPWRDVQGRIIERIAGSPWIGREWARRAYRGKGPLPSMYTHCFSDEELQCVAIEYGVFWQRPDLMHHHENWARKDGATYEKDMPAFLKDANSAEHWAKYKAIFTERKAAGFPGSEPVA